MKQIDLKIIPVDLLEHYKSSFDQSLQKTFAELHDSELSIETFSFYSSVSAVFSSKIEGENIDLDSFIKHKRFGRDSRSICEERDWWSEDSQLAVIIHGSGKLVAVCYEISTTRKRVISMRATRLRVVLIVAHE